MKRHSRDSDADLDSRLLKKPAAALIDLTESDDEEEVTFVSASPPASAAPAPAVFALVAQPSGPVSCKLTVKNVTYHCADLFDDHMLFWHDGGERFESPLKFLSTLVHIFTTFKTGPNCKCPKHCTCYDVYRVTLLEDIQSACMMLPEVKAALIRRKVSLRYYVDDLKKDHDVNTELAEIVMKKHEDEHDEDDEDYEPEEDEYDSADDEDPSNTKVTISRYYNDSLLLRVPLTRVLSALGNVRYEVLH